MRRPRRLLSSLGLAVAIALVAGCSTNEYTTQNAHDDLVRVGWTSTEAQCFLDGLRAFYADQYVAANRQEDARRHIKYAGVSPQGSDLFVRNELSNFGSLSDAEKAKTKALVERCRH
jgi:hypothetical protein